METQLTKTKNTFTAQLLLDFICYAYIILFIYAGFYKLLDFKFFRHCMEHSPLISSFPGVLVYMVPIGELIISGLLFRKSEIAKHLQSVDINPHDVGKFLAE